MRAIQSAPVTVLWPCGYMELVQLQQWISTAWELPQCCKRGWWESRVKAASEGRPEALEQNGSSVSEFFVWAAKELCVSVWKHVWESTIKILNWVLFEALCLWQICASQYIWFSPSQHLVLSLWFCNCLCTCFCPCWGDDHYLLLSLWCSIWASNQQ